MGSPTTPLPYIYIIWWAQSPALHMPSATRRRTKRSKSSSFIAPCLFGIHCLIYNVITPCILLAVNKRLNSIHGIHAVLVVTQSYKQKDMHFGMSTLPMLSHCRHSMHALPTLVYSTTLGREAGRTAWLRLANAKLGQTNASTTQAIHCRPGIRK